MKIFLKNVIVVNKQSNHHLKKVNVLIENGLIKEIDRAIKCPEDAELWDEENAHISPGWFDVGTQIGEPGFEQREDLESVCMAAQSGGFTGLACFPNTNPVLQSKGQIQNILQKSANFLTDIYPIAAISLDTQGLDITEMIDLHHAGAVAFSDGCFSVQSTGLMLRALEYVKSFDGLIINQSEDKGIRGSGLINEGIVGANLGTSGIPSLAEEIIVARDLSLNDYASSKILIHNISSQKSTELIRKAKKSGSPVFASVSYMHLIETDSAVSDFNVNYKVLPPLRSENDQNSLIDALKKGVIDIICSNHVPVEKERKILEFAHAEFGAIGLETCFGALWQELHNTIELDIIIECFSANPRKILNLKVPEIEEGEVANITVFDPSLKWIFKESDIHSKSKNTPYIGKTMLGKVLGIINENKSVKL